MTPSLPGKFLAIPSSSVLVLSRTGMYPAVDSQYSIASGCDMLLAALW